MLGEDLLGAEEHGAFDRREGAWQLHLLAVLEHSPSLLSPWCKRERLRHRALEMATKWQAGLSEAQVDAALATVAAPPDDVACRSP